MTNAPDGFGYRESGRSEVVVTHHGRTAVVLRGSAAAQFLADAQRAEPEDLQQLMARVTGNYKRGNERQAANHPRNARR